LIFVVLQERKNDFTKASATVSKIVSKLLLQKRKEKKKKKKKKTID
jgi:hypothetical protein